MEFWCFLVNGLLLLIWLNVFNTHVLVARMFNRLLDDCVGVSEYGPEVIEYCEEVGE